MILWFSVKNGQLKKPLLTCVLKSGFAKLFYLFFVSYKNRNSSKNIYFIRAVNFKEMDVITLI